MRVEAVDLVAGDVIEVCRAATRFQVDTRIVACSGLKIDNSSLTGETSDNPLETKNPAFFTTFATKGTATGMTASGCCW